MSLISKDLTDAEVATVMGRFEPDALIREFNKHLTFTLAKDRNTATASDYYNALARTVRDQLVSQWIKTAKRYKAENKKRVYYISLEYYMGRTLQNTVVNLGMDGAVGEMLHQLGLDLEELREQELDAALGNGGLGRLAACFLDSMATIGLPAMGYGIRYEFGIFKQDIIDKAQVESPDCWLVNGNPWEIQRNEYATEVNFFGEVKWENGRAVWHKTDKVIAMAYDTPIPGYMNNTVNTLRLWSAKASQDLDLDYFNHGDYFKSVEVKNQNENISRVLYPNDNFLQGKELRLKQQYFLCAASLSDIIRRYKKTQSNFENFHEHVACQLHDTHPTLAIPEMMRVLMDLEGMGWEASWAVTTKTLSYTNHTILPEALEKWGVPLFARLLPRHLEIVYEINRRFIEEIKVAFPGDDARLQRMSIIEEGDEKKVRMGNLCVVGTHAVNGVAALHTKLIKETIFKDFYEWKPDNFQNKTNGITPRRWLRKCNPALSDLITDKITDSWITNLDALKGLIPLSKTTQFRTKFAQVKLDNKVKFAKFIKETHGIVIDPKAMFDIQVKRIHEYKRQLLNCFHMIHLYNLLKANPDDPNIAPRVCFVGGKAAPGYWTAKSIIRLINHVAEVVNNDASIKGKLKIVYLKNYGVSMAEKAIPAADLSEQISTAGLEASGTGNMKFMLNGALTIGTLDGANIEMLEECGDDNMFIFGMKVDEVARLKRNYNPKEWVEKDHDLKRVIDQIRNGTFSNGNRDLFKDLINGVLDGGDTYCLCADFRAYIDCQYRVGKAFKDADRWMEMAVMNTATAGKFSSDRTIADYARDIWGVVPASLAP